MESLDRVLIYSIVCISYGYRGSDVIYESCTTDSKVEPSSVTPPWRRWIYVPITSDYSTVSFYTQNEKYKLGSILKINSIL